MPARRPRSPGLARTSDPRIRYVEPVTVGQPAHVRNDPLTYEIDPMTGAPYEWQFHAVGTDKALNLGRGDPSILVGVLDTGIAAVPDLAGKIAETFWDPSATTSAGDALGHGTFVASIIASRNDDGRGLAGFCGACRLAVYKAPRLTNVQVAEGIRTLTDAHVRVLNLSIVLDAPSQAVIDALDYAIAAGVLVVAAAGNDGQPAIDFPASYLQAPGGNAGPGIAVGASDRFGKRASFSNTGQQHSLLAPGTFTSGCKFGIFGAIPASPPAFETGGLCPVVISHLDGARYAYESGTSYAAPEVAGTAALVWALKPSLTSVQVAAILEQSATRPSGSGWSPTTGWGVLNARAAVEAATGRSAADVFLLQGLSVSRPRAAGDTVRGGRQGALGGRKRDLTRVGRLPNHVGHPVAAGLVAVHGRERDLHLHAAVLERRNADPQLDHALGARRDDSFRQLPLRRARLEDELGRRNGEVVDRSEDHVGLPDGVAGREQRVRDRDAAHAGGLGRADAVVGVLDRNADGGVDAETAGGLEIDVGSGLPSCDLLRGHRGRKEARDATGREHDVDQLAVRRRRKPERMAFRDAPHRVERAREPGRSRGVAVEHPLDDDPVDLFRRLVEPDAVVHVARPFGRAHPHHVPLRAVVPVPAALRRELLAHAVPDLLGVDEHAVHVEDDCADHRATYRRST